ncbi:flagellar hook protein FlgK [Synergistales bacterium]|nr:flagellar hook protein FlgK [Synergistales bacterium]
MGNLFAGLSNGNTALDYYMRGIETAGHNIANSTTEGFARQRVNIGANAAIEEGGFMVGQGVTMSSITRIRNLFLDAQYRAQLPTLGYWETKANNIKNMEFYVGNLDRGTFQTVLDNFWANVEGVHTTPEAATAREVMLESTRTVIESLIRMRSNYDAYRTELNDQVRDMVVEANSLIDGIAELCKEITSAQNAGMNPNDLLDKRDLMAEKLCKLTGATVGSPSLDEADGDYKIDLNGKLLVQGQAQYCAKNAAIINTRHLVLVPMVGNLGYYDVQVEYNQYDHISDLSVASVIIERGATPPGTCSKNGVHELFVERLADGMTWMAGGARSDTLVPPGDRIGNIYDKNQKLDINGSFSLQVGNAGVQALSNSFFDAANQANNGIVKFNPNAHGGETEYEFRIAAGEFETYVKCEFNGTTWDITSPNSTTVITSTGADLILEDIAGAINSIQYPAGRQAFAAAVNPNSYAMTIECANTSEMRGHLISITDFRNTLAEDLGIMNKNPAVEITVTKEDSLVTIANKINAAYKSDLVGGAGSLYSTNPPGVAPSEPEQWLHANVIQEPDGTFYLSLMSDVSGEANRINVLPGNVCDTSGDLMTARLLGLVDWDDPDTSAEEKTTSYMQFAKAKDAPTTIVTRDTPGGDVYVDDAYFIYDGKHFLSESNSFVDARIFKTGKGPNLEDFVWVNRMADDLDRFAAGIRLNLSGLNTRYSDGGAALSKNEAVIIKVDPHLTNGEIFAMLESRDDMILNLEDYLDDIVYEMVTEVNAVHYAGHGIGENADTTGTKYFAHINGRYGALNSTKFLLNEDLAKDVSLIGANSGDGYGHSRGSGEGLNALRIAQLKITKVFDKGAENFNEYFLKFTGDLGSQGFTANYMLKAQSEVSDQILALRESVMGVSTDEELMDIIKFQQGVGAISRYMTAIDDMLDRIINSMGV